ncbi:hypothetical protein [Burkholderia contaminans]|nr:hypothetical protein [Burkholderia contaminans]
MSELDAALADLEGVPDLKLHLDTMLNGFSIAGLAPLKRVSIDVAITKYFSGLVSGTRGADELALIDECAKAVPSLMGCAQLLPALEVEAARIATSHTTFKETEVFAYLLIQVTKNAAT